MALIKRVSRLFTADMHAVLDQIEDPEIVLKQAVREMEEELARQIQRSKWLASEIETADKRIAALADSRSELETKLDLCFENGSEELARKLIRQKLESTKHTKRQEDKKAELEDQLTQHQQLIAVNEDQLEGMRQKAAIFSTEEYVAGADRPGGFATIDDDEVELAFLREKQARAQS